jgi:GPH family glycoside/pentoside/hexuronide:cation symporter
MTEKKTNSHTGKESEQLLETTLGTKIAYSNGVLADNLALQNFSFLGFAFYFAVVGLPVLYISIGFILWSIWDAINDPLIGVLSDRTKTKWGRRKPWIFLATIPLCLTMILLWTPPLDNYIIIFIYFLIMLILFDLFNTMYTVNFNSLWPEMFLTVEDRSSLGVWRNIFALIGLAIAFVLPEFIITDITNKQNLPETPGQFLLNGVIAAIIVGITIMIMLKFGSFERKEFAKDALNAPSWKESYRITLKNKAFVGYCIVAIAIYIVYSILPIMLPFYAVYVIGMDDPGFLIFSGLVVAAASTPLWMYFRKKFGVRRSFIIALIYWAISLLLFMLAVSVITAYLFIIFMGIGLGGSLYLYDQGLAEIIDDDEVRSGLGIRREGAYYGVVSLFNRFSTAINALVIGIVFTGVGWAKYDPKAGTDIILGLRFLVVIWPVIIICIALIFLYLWPIHGKRLEENQKMLNELHKKKKRI